MDAMGFPSPCGGKGATLSAMTNVSKGTNLPSPCGGKGATVDLIEKLYATMLPSPCGGKGATAK